MFYLKTKECRDALKGYESVRAMGSTDALVRCYKNIPYSHSQRQGGHNRVHQKWGKTKSQLAEAFTADPLARSQEQMQRFYRCHSEISMES